MPRGILRGDNDLDEPSRAESSVERRLRVLIIDTRNTRGRVPLIYESINPPYANRLGDDVIKSLSVRPEIDRLTNRPDARINSTNT